MTSVTLLDVAARAGVSRATASLVVRGTGRVSPETRRRVGAVMDELGYVYDRGAAALRTGHVAAVGVVVTHVANAHFGEVIGGVQTVLAGHGYTTVLTESGDDVASQARALRTLREQKVSGVVLVPATGTPPSVLEGLVDMRVEHVLVSRYLDDGDASYVGADDVAGGRAAAEHLLRHGCRDLVYLGGLATVLSRRDRLAGVRSAVTDAGGDRRLRDITGAVSGAGGLELGRRLLASGSLPDGVVCHSDTIAFGLFRALHDAGVASHVRVTGYDDVAAAALWEPPLTSVATHGSALGARAARVLLDRIADPGTPHVVERHQPVLTVRRSCGCR